MGVSVCVASPRVRRGDDIPLLPGWSWVAVEIGARLCVLCGVWFVIKCGSPGLNGKSVFGRCCFREEGRGLTAGCFFGTGNFSQSAVKGCS